MSSRPSQSGDMPKANRKTQGGPTKGHSPAGGHGALTQRVLFKVSLCTSVSSAGRPKPTLSSHQGRVTFERASSAPYTPWGLVEDTC